MDKNRVTISKVPPGIPKGRLQRTPDLDLAIRDLEIRDDAITISATKINESVLLQAMYSLSEGTAETKALQNAALVALSDITPCSILLNIGEFKHRLIFPFPIDGTKTTTKIARKSRWIQVNVPVAPALRPGGYDLNPFPVIASSVQQPAVWALPRIDLSILPRVIGNMNWLHSVEEQILSAREKRALANTDSTKDFPNIFLNMKRSLAAMIAALAHGKKFCVLGVIGKDANEHIAVPHFFLNGLRHSRDTNSIVFDGWVVPQIPGRPDKLFKAPGLLEFPLFPITREEHILWKKIMPAAVESCRRNWEHNASCEYLHTPPPLSIEPWESPICRCGEGKDVADFPVKSTVKPYKEWATRIALPLLSAVSYVETMNPSGVE
ncbi:hypothetical protein NHQ30_000536 [Ciborinia camelliae]|nr:hypothetical protein NHQ30_000536 [Ciborinia camelliae]